jgi:hypothetical protein
LPRLAETCDDNRPCKRCVAYGYGRAETCTSAPYRRPFDPPIFEALTFISLPRCSDSARKTDAPQAAELGAKRVPVVDDGPDRSNTSLDVNYTDTGRSAYHPPSSPASSALSSPPSTSIELAPPVATHAVVQSPFAPLRAPSPMAYWPTHALSMSAAPEHYHPAVDRETVDEGHVEGQSF